MKKLFGMDIATNMPFNSPSKNSLKYISKKDFTGAVSKWSVRLSPYSCPDDLGRVVIKADGAWPGSDIKEWSYDDFEEFVKNFIYNTPEIVAWNSTKSGKTYGGHKFITAFDLPTKEEDDFVDLDALKIAIVNECWHQDN